MHIFQKVSLECWIRKVESKMIKIEKLEEPQILKDNATKWTQEYLDYIHKGGQIPDSVKTRYSHPDIKTQLLKETHAKCAYCESKFTHIEP